jgi:Tfp pilus assembly protein PilO
MADDTLNWLKKLGLTPASLVAGIAVAAAWYATLAPIPGEISQLNAAVQTLATKVEVHSVLIAQMNEIKVEMAGMRKELSTIEGRLSKSYANP